jgi:hypothetical protein
MVRHADVNGSNGTNGTTLADEKLEDSAVHRHHDNGTLDDLGPDPDAGLSEEERAKIVYTSNLVGKTSFRSLYTTGQGASAKTRSQPSAMGLSHQERERWDQN